MPLNLWTTNVKKSVFIFQSSNFLPITTDSATMSHRPEPSRLHHRSSDPLDLLLQPLRPSGVLYCNAELTAPWGVELSSLEGITSVLAVLEGDCLLEVDGMEQRWLASGQLAVIPRGTGHRVRSEDGAPVVDLLDIAVERVSERYEIMRHGGGGQRTHIAYGVVRFEEPSARRLLDALPQALFPTVEEGALWCTETLGMLAREAHSLRPGSEPILTRLADILVVQAIRHWLSSAIAEERSWIAALRDPQIGTALRRMQLALDAPWTIETLAREVGMSRSAFAARFSELVGEGALHHLTRLRMERARSEMRDGSAPVSVVAARHGYSSEAAFSKAYRKFWGEPPGRCRVRRPGA